MRDLRKEVEEKFLVIAHKLCLVNNITFPLRYYREKQISFGIKDLYIANKIIPYHNFILMSDQEAEKLIVYTILNIKTVPSGV